MNNNPTSETAVTSAIKDKTLTPSAMAIILYTLSAIKPGRVISLDYVTIRKALGIKRTSFFMAMRCLKDLNLFTQRTKYTYSVNMKAILCDRP